MSDCIVLRCVVLDDFVVCQGPASKVTTSFEVSLSLSLSHYSTLPYLARKRHLVEDGGPGQEGTRRIHHVLPYEEEKGYHRMKGHGERGREEKGQVGRKESSKQSVQCF